MITIVSRLAENLPLVNNLRSDRDSPENNWKVKGTATQDTSTCRFETKSIR